MTRRLCCPSFKSTIGRIRRGCPGVVWAEVLPYPGLSPLPRPSTRDPPPPDSQGPLPFLPALPTDGYLQKLRLPRIQRQGPDLGEMDAQAPTGKAEGTGLGRRQGRRGAQRPLPICPPVNARALDAQCDAKVDAGPARVRQATITAHHVASNGLDPLEGAFPLQRLLFGLLAGLGAPCGGGALPLHLQKEQEGAGAAPPPQPPRPSSKPPPRARLVPGQSWCRALRL